jgi:ribonuclease J
MTMQNDPRPERAPKRAGRPAERPLRVIPLGGVGEIGKNATVIEYGGDVVLVDAGVKFPEEEQHGIDLVLPDVSYVHARAEHLRGILLTHGHEDHIGALPYLLPQLVRANKPVPLYGSALTLGFVRAKLQERKVVSSAELHVVEPGKRYRIGRHLAAEFLPAAHSIPGSHMVALHTPGGIVITTGDFKLDPTPVFGPPTDLERLCALGALGVTLLLSDCTRIEQPGRTPTEQVVVAALDRWIAQAAGRVILTTFASNISRVAFAFQAAERYGRRVAVVGRSMEQHVQVAADLGVLTLPSAGLLPAEAAHRLPPGQVLLVTTGSQGEPTSALARIAAGTHPQIRLRPGDTVILSATPIPGNDKTFAQTLDNLFHGGAEVIYHALDQEIHVSGHASREELREVLEITRPRFVAPIHGEYRHQALYGRMAAESGYRPEAILLPELGEVLEFRSGGVQRKRRVRAGAVLVDGLTVGRVSHEVLRDRAHLAGDGVLVATLVVDRETGALLAEPEVVARGVVQLEEQRDGAFLAEASHHLRRALRQGHGQIEYGELVERTKEALDGYIWRRLHLRPLILPVITLL